MLYKILAFLLELSLVHLLTAMFMLLDLLLLSVRINRVRLERGAREVKRRNAAAEARENRRAFEARKTLLTGYPS